MVGRTDFLNSLGVKGLKALLPCSVRAFLDQAWFLGTYPPTPPLELTPPLNQLTPPLNQLTPTLSQLSPEPWTNPDPNPRKSRYIPSNHDRVRLLLRANGTSLQVWTWQLLCFLPLCLIDNHPLVVEPEGPLWWHIRYQTRRGWCVGVCLTAGSVRPMPPVQMTPSLREMNGRLSEAVEEAKRETQRCEQDLTTPKPTPLWFWFRFWFSLLRFWVSGYCTKRQFSQLFSSRSLAQKPGHLLKLVECMCCHHLAIHSLLRWKMTTLLILTTYSLLYVSLKEGWENVLFELRSERGNSP